MYMSQSKPPIKHGNRISEAKFSGFVVFFFFVGGGRIRRESKFLHRGEKYFPQALRMDL